MEVYDITNKSIKEINNEIKRLENQLGYYLDKKSKAFQSTQPKAVVYDKEVVDGGLKRESKFDCYIIANEELDPFINLINEEIYRLAKYVNNELQRIGEYEPLMKRIVELREVQGSKWEDIAILTSYCSSQCRNIYRKYKNRRNV